jgi:hypothetical protein
VDINKSYESIIKNIKFSAKRSLHYYEQKKQKSSFHERCSKLLAQRNKTTAVVKGSKQMNADNLNNIRCEARRKFRKKKKKEYLKQKNSPTFNKQYEQ